MVVHRPYARLALALIVVGCEAEAEPAEPPPAIEPVAVGEESEADEPAGESEVEEEADVEALRARVAELEAQLGECRGDQSEATAEAEPSGAVQMEPIPEGVDVPAEAPEPVASSERASRRRRRRPETDEEEGGSLLDIPMILLGE